MIRLEFADGCSGLPEESVTIIAPRDFFWEFGKWCETGHLILNKSGSTSMREKVEAESLVRERSGGFAPEYDLEPGLGLGSRHWRIESTREVIEWYMIFFESNRGGVPYRDPRCPEREVRAINISKNDLIREFVDSEALV